MPGADEMLPLRLPLIAGAGVLWLVGRFSADSRSGLAIFPPFWPLVGIYAIGGFIAFFTGRSDLDSVNGLKYLVEACMLAPMLYLLAWQYMRSPKDAERLI